MMRFVSSLSFVLASFSIIGCKPNYILCQLQPGSLFSFCVESESSKEYERPVSELREEAWICVSPEDARGLKDDYQTCQRELSRCE